MAVDARGEIKRMKLFEEDFKVIDSEDTSGMKSFSVYTDEGNDVELIHNALVLGDRKSTRLNSSHSAKSRMPSSA